ncbi:hypothetical protein P7M55_22150 [Vibrio parahaemolyticus]|nr:hypothetical protein [Vibrio parahaemolyticus]MDG2903163.1 hypothetical protein [Vibrio parahaemolyticus]
MSGYFLAGIISVLLRKLILGQRRASEDRAAIVITKRFCRIVTEKDFFLVASTEWGKNKLVAHSSIC